MIAQRKLGPFVVSAIGMGCMPLSFPHERDPHHEVLVGKAFHSWNGSPEQKSKVVLATKVGITREENGTMFGLSGRNSSQHYLFRAVEASAFKLGVSKIPLWQHHRTDLPNVLRTVNFSCHGCGLR